MCQTAYSLQRSVNGAKNPARRYNSAPAMLNEGKRLIQGRHHDCQPERDRPSSRAKERSGSRNRRHAEQPQQDLEQRPARREHKNGNRKGSPRTIPRSDQRVTAVRMPKRTPTAAGMTTRHFAGASSAICGKPAAPREKDSDDACREHGQYDREDERICERTGRNEPDDADRDQNQHSEGGVSHRASTGGGVGSRQFKPKGVR